MVGNKYVGMLTVNYYYFFFFCFLPNIPVLVSNLFTPVSIGITGNLCFFNKLSGESRRKYGKKRPSL